MSNAWIAGARPFCNTLKGSGNPTPSSQVRSLVHQVSSRVCIRPLSGSRILGARCQYEWYWRSCEATKKKFKSWNLKDVREPHFSNSRSFVTSTPNLQPRARGHSSVRQRANVPPSEPWRRYTQDEGVPLPDGNLELPQIDQIFGSSMTVEDGNRLLRQLQHRRLSGALAHEQLPPPMQEDLKSVEAALMYLRETYPIDEQAAADYYVQSELKKVENEALKEGTRLRLYKRENSDTEDPDMDPNEPDPIYGDSVVERVRRANEKRNAAEREELSRQASEADSQLSKDPSTGAIQYNSSPAPSVDDAKPMSEWVKRHYEKATLSTTDSAPDWTPTKRLGPSLLFVLLAIPTILLAAHYYTPPTRSERLLPDIPTSLTTIGALFLTNILVFVAWRIPPCWRLLNKYFVLVPAMPFAASLLGNVFSHQTFSHLGINMLMLWLVGTRLHEEIGRGDFLALYFIAGLMGSAANIVYYTLTRNFVTCSFGASGSICGLLAMVCLLDPGAGIGGWVKKPGGGGDEEKVEQKRVRVGESWVPLPSHILLMALVVIDLMGLRRRTPGHIDHMGHLGGYLVGIVGAMVVNDRTATMRQTRARMGEREKVEETRTFDYLGLGKGDEEK
ncbi:MAG: hypothetical protein M1820_002347 [Bogoriella megaspora]|nr:MAG: hypothetical protein M1820_002347 [Bogoriella megaspora]